MDTFIARQPIFDRQGAVHAYELLYRTGPEQLMKLGDPTVASSHVIVRSLLLPGLAALTRGGTVFVNVTRDLLVQDTVRMLPSESAVLEIVETVEPDAEVLEACARLRAAGYRLALDDFALSSPWASHIGLVDIVKVDVLASGMPECKEILRLTKRTPQLLLAEKVETSGMHLATHKLGFHLFQGYFYSRPATLAGRDIPAAAISCMRLLQEIHRPEMDMRALAAIVEREVGLSYKLLRYVNSALFGWSGSVTSIDHALRLLGEIELRRWVAVVAITGMVNSPPDELVRLALLRGRLCEMLAQDAGLEDDASSLFLLGILSLVDALFDRSMAEALEGLPLPAELKAALLGEPGPMADVLALAVAYLDAAWDRIDAPASRLGIKEASLAELGAGAYVWCDADGFGEGVARAA